MKKLLLTITGAALLSAGLYSCGKVKDEIKKVVFQAFSTNPVEIGVTIPANSVVNQEIGLATTTVSFNLDSTIKAVTSNQFGLSDISSVKLEEMKLNLSNANNDNNIQNFSSIKATLTNPANPRESTTIEQNSIPDQYAGSITLPTTSTNLKSYLAGNSINISMGAVARRATTIDLNGKISMKLRVE